MLPRGEDFVLKVSYIYMSSNSISYPASAALPANHLFKELFLFFALFSSSVFFSGCKSDPPASETADAAQHAPDSTALFSPPNDEFVKEISTDRMDVAIKTSGSDVLKDLNLSVGDKKQNVLNKSLKFDGVIRDAVTADLNNDGKEEVYVFNQSAGSGNYGQLFAFQFNGDKLDSISMDELPVDVQDQYLGSDSFAIVGKNLVRYIPLYKEMDANCCPTGGQKVLKYRLTERSGRLRLVLEEEKK